MTKPIDIYGIKNCDTMKKAFAWLDRNKIAYAFHDHKKSGADADILKTAIKQHGWESVINRKGTTWRALPERDKETMNETKAIAAALENPSLIKRPLIAYGSTIYLGFDEKEYKSIFK